MLFNKAQDAIESNVDKLFAKKMAEHNKSLQIEIAKKAMRTAQQQVAASK
ncbi:hypothetical protein [Paenibacillus borealis]|nr:hypothetical protein [Paenibacillus borealis]